MIRIDPTLEIDERELVFRTSRASGPGGQHVNRTESRVEVCFDVAGSPSLNPWQRQRLLERLAPRLTQEGVLVIAAQDERSQLRNKEIAVERLRAVLAAALYRPPKRVATKPSLGAKRRRLEDKSKRGDVKRMRGKINDGS